MPSKSVAWMQDNGHRPDSVHLSPRLSIPWTPLEVSTSFILMSAGAEPNQVVVGTVVLVRKLFAPVHGRSMPSEGPRRACYGITGPTVAGIGAFHPSRRGKAAVALPPTFCSSPVLSSCTPVNTYSSSLHCQAPALMLAKIPQDITGEGPSVEAF